MRILVTGGCGFIGSNYIRYVFSTGKVTQLTNIDRLTYAANPNNLVGIANDPRYSFIKGDIASAELVDSVVKRGFDAIVNFAAESHVDRSLYGAENFIQSNVLGACILLEAAKKYAIKRFIQVSTDEVYGSIEGASFKESDHLLPSSPYSASKASADLLCKAYHHTFGIPVIIVRSTNNYGPYQHPEKFIPLFITNALENKELPLYGDGSNVRDWLYVSDNVAGIQLALEKGRPGEIYNIGSGCEKTNLEVARMIVNFLDRPETLIKFVKDRPGHDRRYSLDFTKAKKEVGYEPTVLFEQGLNSTINWYVSNKAWIKEMKSKGFEEFYRKHYKI